MKTGTVTQDRKSSGARQFTDAEIRRMKEAAADGVTHTEIGARFGVGATKISKLLRSALSQQREAP